MLNARARHAVLAALLFSGGAAFASAPLVAEWAVPLRDLVSRRVRCAIPDGGVRVRCQMRVPRALLAMARQASGSQDAPSPPQPPGPLPQPHAARAS